MESRSRWMIAAVGFVLSGCQTMPSMDKPQNYRDVARVVTTAQEAFLEASRDGGTSEVMITKSDGTIIRGEDYFNSTKPMSIREIRPGTEAVAVGYENCDRSDQSAWNCQGGGMYLGLPDLGDANIRSARITEGACTFGACRIVGACVSGTPQLGENDDERAFLFLEDGSTMHCYVIRLMAKTNVPVSMEDSEYFNGRQVVRAFYQFDLNQVVEPITLPNQKP
jgi:hypothetical protein